MAPKSYAQKKAQKNYMKKFFRIEIRVTQEERDIIQAHAAAGQESVNKLIKRAIKNLIQEEKQSG